jgi:sugar lactone lactonase YvrE
LYRNDLPAPREYDAGRAVRVSFDRPIESSQPIDATGEGAEEIGSAQFLRFEFPLVRYLERRGYDIAYTTNVDVHEDASTLLSRRLFLSIGHDEYWSIGERNGVEAARGAGVSLAFLSANVGYWRIRLDPSSSGIPDRIITCYKGSSRDPEYGTPLETDLFRNSPGARPENALVGVMYDLYTRVDGFPLIVTEPDSWVFGGMGLAAGDSLGNLVGYEWDHVFDNGKQPAGLKVLGNSPAFGVYGRAAPSNMTLYEPTPRSFVFAAGTIDFGWGTGRTGYTNGRTEQVVNNLMVHAGISPTSPTDVDATDTHEGPGSAIDVAPVAGSGAAGFSDGAAETAEFDIPAAVAAGADGTLYVTDSRNHRIRAVSASGSVTTLAGCGPNDQALGHDAVDDAVGTKACFDAPTGIALGPDDALYVADSGNSLIRRVAKDGATTTYAGSSSGLSDGALRNARFKNPQALAFAPDGSLYVADSGNDSIRRVTAAGVTTIAKGIKWPTAIAAGSDGSIFVAATAEGRLYLISSGIATVIANQSGTNGNQDGPADDARLRPANGLILLDRRLVFSDTANNTVRVLDLDAKTISRLAGTGHYGSKLGTGSVAELSLPRGLATFGGRIIAVDGGNNRIVSIRPPPSP